MSEVLTTSLNEKVARSFGDKAMDYNRYAHIQRQAAHRFMELSQDVIHQETSPCLEIGCGTGFITQPLVSSLRDVRYIAADLSAEMLQACKNDLRNPNGIEVDFEQRDGEAVLDSQTYGLIVTALTAQWFSDAEKTFLNYLEALKPGGLLLYSYLDERCFPEWKALCAESGVPFTGNILPTSRPMQIDSSSYEWEYFSTELFTEIFERPAAFFQNLKRIGAGTRHSDSQSYPGATIQLDTYWKEKTKRKFQITYGITFGGIRRKSQ